jgi:hypothetical protein
MSPPPTTHEHPYAATSMREAITIEYIVLLMTDSHPASLKVLHRSLRGISIVACESSIAGGARTVADGCVNVPAMLYGVCATRPCGSLCC